MSDKSQFDADREFAEDLAAKVADLNHWLSDAARRGLTANVDVIEFGVHGVPASIKCLDVRLTRVFTIANEEKG